MVSRQVTRERTSRPGGAGPTGPSNAFHAWRVFLTRVFDGAARGLSGLFASWRRLLSGLYSISRAQSVAFATKSGTWLGSMAQGISNPGKAVEVESVRGTARLASIGVSFLLVGTVASLLFGAGGPSHFVDIAWTAAWAPLRLAIMWLVAPRRGARLRTATLSAWGVGLAPYALAISPLTRIVAFFASAILTFRALCGGAPLARKEAFAMVLGAWGGQAAVEVASWIVRAGVVVAFLGGR